MGLFVFPLVSRFICHDYFAAKHAQGRATSVNKCCKIGPQLKLMISICLPAEQYVVLGII